MEPSVLLTISGDVQSTEVQADTNVAIGDLVAGWAARCSSYRPEDLVVLSADNSTLFDPSDNLANLGLGYGSVLRLVTGEEAMEVLNVRTVDTPASQPVGREPQWGDTQAERIAAPTAAPGSPNTAPNLGERRPWPQLVGHNADLPSAPWPPETSAPYDAQPGGHAPSGEPPWQPSETRFEPAGSHYDPRIPPELPLVPPQYPGPVFPAEQSQPTAAQGEDAFLPQKVSAGQRIARAFKAVFSHQPAPAAQTGGFAKATVPKAGERYRQAMQATDRAHNLEVMIRTAPLNRCMVIAVVSPKGGAGKTTMTALLGTLFAELRRDPVLALDANPDFGNLKDKLAPANDTVSATDELAQWLADRPAVTPAELSSRLGVGPHGLRFLPTPVGNLERMVLAADFTLYRELLARLRDYEGIILVDCGTGLLDPPVRAALETADQILLVTDSSADTAGLVVTAAQHLPAATPTWLVANKMPERGAMVDLDRVAAAIPQLRGVTVVPEQRLTENVVTPAFDWAQGPGPWQEPLREIAARLAAYWRTLP